MTRPLTLSRAWRLLEKGKTCGQCQYIRPRLERLLDASPGSNPGADTVTVSLARLLDLRLYCPRERVTVNPLEVCCAFGKAHQTGRVIMVEIPEPLKSTRRQHFS